MINALLFFFVVSLLLLALAIDLATLVAWLQSLWRRARH